MNRIGNSGINHLSKASFKHLSYLNFGKIEVIKEITK